MICGGLYGFLRDAGVAAGLRCGGGGDDAEAADPDHEEGMLGDSAHVLELVKARGDVRADGIRDWLSDDAAVHPYRSAPLQNAWIAAVSFYFCILFPKYVWHDWESPTY